MHQKQYLHKVLLGQITQNQFGITQGGLTIETFQKQKDILNREGLTVHKQYLQERAC